MFLSSPASFPWADSDWSQKWRSLSCSWLAYCCSLYRRGTIPSWIEARFVKQSSALAFYFRPAVAWCLLTHGFAILVKRWYQTEQNNIRIYVVGGNDLSTRSAIRTNRKEPSISHFHLRMFDSSRSCCNKLAQFESLKRTRFLWRFRNKKSPVLMWVGSSVTAHISREVFDHRNCLLG